MKSPLAALFALSVLVAQTPNSPTIPKETDVNPELLKLVIYDQWDRGNDMFGDRHPTGDEKVNWNAVGKRDQERQAATRKLLADGKLQTARDYRFAALIFQHSTDTAGYLLAHVLAVTAVGKGDSSSEWLAAATMDRYLHSLNQPQVFGTKFRQPEGVRAKDPLTARSFPTLSAPRGAGFRSRSRMSSRKVFARESRSVVRKSGAVSERGRDFRLADAAIALFRGWERARLVLSPDLTTEPRNP